ncbi:hypothetical protein RF11_03865 [Thelohanellus kitauei]|uniref:Uncharacterized protein n=1 Tax=Thelohanellus kitauei TaxID=669202 RepID=A0A0C2IGK9_THEKT|nr:hypothetical protein RF11_03865 [Thelohanellus kitauei]
MVARSAMMEEVKNRINEIIIDGLLETSNATRIDPENIYSENILVRTDLNLMLGDHVNHILAIFKHVQMFGIEPIGSIGALIVSSAIQTAFANIVLNILNIRDTNIPSHCQMLFHKCNSTCSEHLKIDILGRSLPAGFISKFRHIVQYLCELLEGLCNDDYEVLDNKIERILEAYLRLHGPNIKSNATRSTKINIQNAKIDSNAHKSCLIMFDNTAASCFGFPGDNKSHLELFQKKF